MRYHRMPWARIIAITGFMFLVLPQIFVSCSGEVVIEGGDTGGGQDIGGGDGASDMDGGSADGGTPSDGGLNPDGGQPPADGGKPPKDGGQTPGDGGGPTSCSIEADCEVAGACPKDAKLGCACATTPSGKKCVPKCTVPTDCPNSSLTCSPEGVCVPDQDGGQPPDDGGKPPKDGGGPNPDGGPPPKDGGGPGPDGGGGPVPCTYETDCDLPGACPPDALKGCTCVTDPHGSGKLCVPACSSTDDCPKPPDKTLICELDAGICVPQ